MTVPSIDYRRHVHRPTRFIVLGLLLVVAATYLGYDVVKRRANIEPVPSAYTYTVKQSVDKSVVYFPSSFYDGGPGQNTGYVMSLTDKIATTFHYSFTGSEQQSLSYAYDIRAVVRGLYSFKGDETDSANVWSKEFQILKPVHGTVNAKDLSFDPSAQVPFDDYRKLIEELRSSLTLPIRSEVVVTFTINVSGVVDGKTFNDLRTASVSAPIEEQIYSLTQKYDKEDTKQVVAAAVQTNVDKRAQYETYGGIALGVLALAALIYGFRKQIFKTPYQRELDKIYRYHDGLIVRAGHQADLSGKHVVPVQSFDDILNLEEELKSPIVASNAGASATHFMIINGDVVYRYTLGTVVRESGRSLEEIEASIEEHHIVTSPRRVHDIHKRPSKRM